jgi:hypothetical protein
MLRVRAVAVIALAVLGLWWLLSGDEVAEAQAPTPDPAVEDFVPSEELPADSAISFPVDI